MRFPTLSMDAFAPTSPVLLLRPPLFATAPCGSSVARLIASAASRCRPLLRCFLSVRGRTGAISKPHPHIMQMGFAAQFGLSRWPVLAGEREAGL